MNTSSFSRFIKREWLQLVLLLLPFLAVALVIPHATERVPMQWGLDGRVNWTAPKSWGLWSLPCVAVFTTFLIMAFESFDKRKFNSDGTLTEHGNAVRCIRFGISVFLAAILAIQISAALGHHPDVSHYVPAGMGLLFAFLGSMFGKLKPNRYAGFRVPWTMNSETVWVRTHQAAGKLWMIGGIAEAVCSLLLPARLMAALTVVWILVLVFAPLMVAWQAAREEKRTASGN